MARSRWRPFSGARRPTYPMMRLVGLGWWWSGLKRVVSTPLPQCLMVVMPWLRSSVMVLVEGARVRSQWLWMWVIQRQAVVLNLGRW